MHLSSTNSPNNVGGTKTHASWSPKGFHTPKKLPPPPAHVKKELVRVIENKKRVSVKMMKEHAVELEELRKSQIDESLKRHKGKQLPQVPDLSRKPKLDIRHSTSASEDNITLIVHKLSLEEEPQIATDSLDDSLLAAVNTSSNPDDLDYSPNSRSSSSSSSNRAGTPEEMAGQLPKLNIPKKPLPQLPPVGSKHKLSKSDDTHENKRYTLASHILSEDYYSAALASDKGTATVASPTSLDAHREREERGSGAHSRSSSASSTASENHSNSNSASTTPRTNTPTSNAGAQTHSWGFNLSLGGHGQHHNKPNQRQTIDMGFINNALSSNSDTSLSPAFRQQRGKTSNFLESIVGHKSADNHHTATPTQPSSHRVSLTSKLGLGKSKHQSVNSTQVFGLALPKDSLQPPLIIEKALEYLDREEVLVLEGLFRISGDHKEIQSIKALVNEGKDVDFYSMTKNPHTVTSVMKLYLRELPEPLLTYELYDLFIASQCVLDKEARYTMMKKVLGCLPQGYKLVLAKLIRFMGKVASYRDINKMEPKNLAIVFGPNLLRQEGDSLASLISDTPHSNSLVATLIEDYEYFFPLTSTQ